MSNRWSGGMFSLAGTVLIRSNDGQLMLVSQQALVQAQNQTPNNTSLRWTLPANSPVVKIQTPQVVVAIL